MAHQEENCDYVDRYISPVYVRVKDIKVITRQLEFYFSDANLRFDRFLRQKVFKDADGFVSLFAIVKFNKMLEFTNDIVVVAKAAAMSKLLKLSSDLVHVRRIKRLPPEEDLKQDDEKIIFVDNLPLESSIDSIREKFKRFGKIVRIKLPKNECKTLQGYAFIQFEKTKSAKNALRNSEKANLMNCLDRLVSHDDEQLRNMVVSELEKSTLENPKFSKSILNFSSSNSNEFCVISKMNYTIVKNLVIRSRFSEQNTVQMIGIDFLADLKKKEIRKSLYRSRIRIAEITIEKDQNLVVNIRMHNQKDAISMIEWVETNAPKIRGVQFQMNYSDEVLKSRFPLNPNSQSAKKRICGG
jgi:RNA recognition motif-containing protein